LAVSKVAYAKSAARGRKNASRRISAAASRLDVRTRFPFSRMSSSSARARAAAFD
jgi:hypothetical protein